MSKEERKLILELICKEQINMILDDSNNYKSNEYVMLEGLKVKIKDM